MAVSRINEAGLNVNQYGNRNLTINGAMEVAQRGTSFNQPADGAYTLDRFAVFRNGAGIVDVDQSTTVPTGQGFKNSFKCTVDTADSSLGSTDFGGFLTKIEGQDLKRFEFGNSSAKKFALSFWARSSITGTYSVAFRNGAANRYLVKEYTISSADTWQHITITDTADVTGTWTTDATTGLDLRWCLWEGGFSAAADTWGAGNIVGSSSNVNWAASAGNTFYITGVQLEVGDTATDFEHRTFADELTKCKRYFEKVAYDGGATFIGGGMWYNSTAPYVGCKYKVTKRAVPTVTSATDSGGYSWYVGGASRTSSAMAFSRQTSYSVRCSQSGGLSGSGGTSPDATHATWLELTGSGASIEIDAEL